MKKNVKTVERRSGKDEKKNTTNKKRNASKDQAYNKLKNNGKENEKKKKEKNSMNKSIYVEKESNPKDNKLQTRLERDPPKNAEKNGEKKTGKKSDKRYSRDEGKTEKNKNINFKHSETGKKKGNFLCCFCCGGNEEELSEIQVYEDEFKLLNKKRQSLEEDEEEKRRLKLIEEEEEEKRRLKLIEEEEEEKRRLKLIEEEEEEKKRRLKIMKEEDEILSSKKKGTMLINKDMKAKLFTKKKAKLNFLGAAAAPTPPEEKYCIGPPPEVRKTTINVNKGIYLIYNNENNGQLEIHYSKTGIEGHGVLAYISSEIIPDFYFDSKHSKQIILKNISNKMTSVYFNDLKPYYECYIEFIKLKKKFNGTLYFLPAFESQPPPQLDIIFFNTREKKLSYAPIEKPVEFVGDILFVIQKGLKIFTEEVEVEKLCNYMKCYGALLSLP
ncbi:conserved Plasmodium protein, unknown function [Plasmodium berghei]|uniref:IMP1-like protein, putative n=2 Tax=Plasmodium berghei TaxID=5821 RepID=A0A509AN94_PLABA|nr:IMP1-like protein, putative [Plasmodium berghei ANKA]CXI73217.1 conserved Plasmodium protein, unknown function [Plasmodium berghei]SCM24514.1 conserved Plasmodium protein, unknown function [Plasmodium berghei]SCN27086.1 conserved Plasmodium protein, unknown function [Plasmodium berghei]SCO61580.1 conserved Plasmodium protein, unknown function [Plasmodium berghei]SCO63508.1 conserved Plasmodium protein, unknown function [Plasmodium berghei]|eukprot:XP_034422720.1 IMP1-like protein, putative [Plasmodium berghei ANKA]